MYLKFYGLREKPFGPTPDPRFLFLTAGHREALAQLIYGVQERKGFMVLVGEVGTGKTTLLRTLLKRLDANTAVAFVFNSTLTFEEMLEYILEDFGIAKPGGTRVERLVALNRFLIERRRAGENTVVIFDEAQNLDIATLEQIRLLSNFETTTDKLLQIILVGQPELKANLARPELRQLRQRLGLRCIIPPLTQPEVREYVRARLRTAGATDLNVFTDAALQRIAEYSRGIPRVVNMLCDHSLLIGYAEQTRRLDQGIVARAIRYLEEEGSGAERSRFRLRSFLTGRWTIPSVAVGAIAAVAVAATGFDNVADVSNAVSALLTSVTHWWRP